MSDNIIERAEAWLDLWAGALFVPASKATGLTSELVNALKAARAEIAEQKEWIVELTTSDE